jgi:hypothetical protein
MAFTPSILTGSYGAGDSLSLVVRATLTTPLSSDVYLAVVDNTGVLEGGVYIEPSSQSGVYYASASMSSRLPAGCHRGALEVRLCRDQRCSAQHPGSPAYLPYALQVLPGNLTPLTRWPSLRDWETFQGNAAHTGHVPVTLDPSRFSHRWSWRPSASDIQLSPPVIANGLVYVANSTRWTNDTPRTLFALRESDKEMQWHVDFGGVRELNPPAVSGGKVFASTTGGSSAAMWSFDAATGAQLSKMGFNSQWEHYYAPTIEGGVVYSACASTGGMCTFNLADGALKWFVSPADSDEWTPAVDENHAYSYGSGVLTARVKSTGQLAFTITDPQAGSDINLYSVHGSPVLGTQGNVLTVSGENIFQANRLLSFNTVKRNLNWSIPGRYGGNPVLAKGVVYATTIPEESFQLNVEARSEATGALLWSWTPPRGDSPRHGSQGFYSDLLVTDNLLFVSTSSHVYAIDLATHAPVWSYWKGGNLAISANGVLYITTGGTIGAVNLK